MQRLLSFFSIFFLLMSFSHAEDIEKEFIKTYGLWQQGMATKNYRVWDSITASNNKREVRNKIYSEKFSYPEEVFAVPFLPPAAKDLKLLQAKASGQHGKAVFFGKVDFGVGGVPTENLLVVSFLKEGGFWRFAKAEYVNLSALPDVRGAILNGDYSYIKGQDFNPAPVPYKNTVKLSSPVSIIGKVYAYCPNREVRAKVNNVSNHLFQNTKDAEVVIGGVKPGANEIQIAIKTLPGGQNNEPLTVRVYALSQVKGVKPVKVYEYLVNEKEAVKGVQTVKFTLDQAALDQLRGK